MKPLPNNLIFYDTEFSSLNPYEGELLSIGAVKLDGEEFYVEIDHRGPISEWVRENIWSELQGPKVARHEASARLKKFVGKDKPFMMANVNDFDVLYTHKLLGGVDESPFYWIPIDFASILFARGINPEDYINRDPKLFQDLGIDVLSYNQHNALDDAKLVRETYLKMFTQQTM